MPQMIANKTERVAGLMTGNLALTLSGIPDLSNAIRFHCGTFEVSQLPAAAVAAVDIVERRGWPNDQPAQSKDEWASAESEQLST